MPANLLRHRSHRLLAAAALVGAAACAQRRPVVVVAPVMDAEQEALRLEDHTQLEGPTRIVFDWDLNEQGTRIGGRGVARIEPPYKARLDLFHDSGESILSASLVEGTLRLPPDAPDDILPPADLMWGVLGVFRPELGTELIGADEIEGDGVRLRYRYSDGRELHYIARGGVLETLELVDSGHVVHRVQVSLEAPSRYPTRATYRNMADYRELRIEREDVERMEPFPDDTFYPTWAIGR